jgi:hypothetical protein
MIMTLIKISKNVCVYIEISGHVIIISMIMTAIYDIDDPRNSEYCPVIRISSTGENREINKMLLEAVFKSVFLGPEKSAKSHIKCLGTHDFLSTFYFVTGEQKHLMHIVVINSTKIDVKMILGLLFS